MSGTRGRTSGSRAGKTASGRPRRGGTSGGKVPAGPGRGKSATPPRAPAPRAFAGAIAAASAKERILFEMVRARVALHAALQALQPPAAEEPTGPGEWNVREHVLHLCHRDLEAGRAVESALHGIAPSWADFDRDEIDRFDTAGLDSLRSLSWENAHRLLLSSRNDLMAALDSIPEEPAGVWSPAHPLGAMLLELGRNDLHHADIIKHWRTQRGV